MSAAASAACASAAPVAAGPVGRAARRIAGTRIHTAASTARRFTTNIANATPPRVVRCRSAVIDTSPAAAAAAGDKMSIRTYVLSELDATQRLEILKRPRVDFSSILGTVKPIVDAVATRGDDAVREFPEKFDGVKLDDVVVVGRCRLTLGFRIGLTPRFAFSSSN